MARPLRIEFPGAVYHITARGNARQDIFIDDADRQLFLDVLANTVDRYNWLCHAYCLMGNHYHLLIETPDPNLSLGMRQLNGVYTQRFNRLHNRVGHVFQGRFKAILVEKQSYLLELSRYIANNPVAAKLVKHPADYKWSSYLYTATQVKKPLFLSCNWLLAQFSQDRLKARKLYREFVCETITSKDKPWQNLVGQLVLGSDDFVKKIQHLAAKHRDHKEVPKTQRFPGRPTLPSLFGVKQQMSKAARNRLIKTAHLDYGYTLKEIADQVGIHYTTVSRVINADKI